MVNIYVGEFQKDYSYDQFKEDAMKFGQFDDDASGANGTDYLIPGIQDEGFSNNLEYWAHAAYEANQTLEGAINDFMQSLSETYNGYCEYTYEIKQLSNENYQVAFATRF